RRVNHLPLEVSKPGPVFAGETEIQRSLEWSTCCFGKTKKEALEIKIDDCTLCQKAMSIVDPARCPLPACCRSGQNQTLPGQAVSRQRVYRWPAGYSGAGAVRL